jgi:hypothetical protein
LPIQPSYSEKFEVFYKELELQVLQTRVSASEREWYLEEVLKKRKKETMQSLQNTCSC